MSLTKVEQIALDRALALLRSIQAQYKIIMPDGTEFGELVLAPVKAKRTLLYKKGELTAYFLPLVSDMKPSEVRVLSGDRFGAVHLRRALSGWTSHRWGNGNSITSVNVQANTVEVLRIA